MKNYSILFLLSILLLSVLSCMAPATEKASAADLAQIKTDIQAMEDAYAAGLKAKDADALRSYYADDAIDLPNNEPIVSGRAAILARLKDQMTKDTSGTTMVFEVLEIIPAGDKIIEIGKSIATDKAGKASTGKYLCIFEKRDGKYACIRGIWNNDAPDKE
ncbi:MAG: nuclear transport factor 2 family protein [Thermoanaerobaculia bacterium]|nr:nuclear transport factor 2 family protein [Thermoanaerobaculia bacterium]